MNKHETINYVEFPSKDLEKTKIFFSEVFGWQFQDYGADYIAFSNQGLDGGFYQSDKKVSTDTGSVLIVFYSDNLETTLAKVKAAGGTVIKPVFSFPGGRRFHFGDINGNEYAVWSNI